jgi:hypothetical protein
MNSCEPPTTQINSIWLCLSICMCQLIEAGGSGKVWVLGAKFSMCLFKIQIREYQAQTLKKILLFPSFL